MNRKTHFALLSLAALLLSGAAQSQTMIGGGKAAVSFPIVISQPGHYKLAGNLTVPNGSTSGIHVTSPYVTIDLNGFTLGGPNVCSTQTKTCSVAGMAFGIITDPVINLTVRNGTVRGFSGTGIRAGDGLRVEGVTVTHNGAGGITAGHSALIDRVVATHNGVTWQTPAAISVVLGSMITNSTAIYNLGHGFKGGSLFTSSATYNNGFGISSPDSYTFVQQSNFTGNTQGSFNGNVQSFGNNICGAQAC